ncbi:MAG TPA: Ig-like domain-containing protein [Longimicrobium sp.]|jgi:hypothetical protein
MRRFFLRALSGLAAAILLAACEDSGTGSVRVASVHVSAPADSVAAGTTLQLGAQLRDAGGVELSGRTVEWQSDNPAVAEVDASGVVSARAPGTVTISARSDGMTGVRTLKVVPLRVVPGSLHAFLAPGQSAQLAVRVLDASGQPVEGRAVRWTASDPTLVEVSATGRVTALRAGHGQVTATVDGGAGVVQVYVYDRGLHVWPDTVAALPGETRQLTIRAILEEGAPVALGSGAWESSDPSVARVDAEGRVTAVAAGRATITAVFGATRVSSSVNVVTYPQPLRFASVSGGRTHSCALTTDGRVYCWGSNEQGQLGTRQPSDRCERFEYLRTVTRRYPFRCTRIPLPADTDLRFVAVSAGDRRSCALTAAGSAYCWGEGAAVPTALPGGVAFRSISGAACGVSTRNEAYCWGSAPGSAPAPVPGGISFNQVDVGYAHTCGVATDGAAWCWGGNPYGELGVSGKPESCNAVDCSRTPFRVEGSHTFRSIVAGTFFTCALDATGRAYCWGSGFHGKLGNGQELHSHTPVAVSPPNTFASLSAGGEAVCGLDQGGNTFCWGNDVLRLDGTRPISTTIPTRSAPQGTLRSIELGGLLEVCGIGTDGILVCHSGWIEGRIPGQ